MRKPTARLRLPATRNAITALFSSLLANTSIASSGCLLAATRLLDHAKNAWSSTIPTRMKIGAGDNRSSENGAAASATSGPHVWRLLKPSRMNAIAAAERTTPEKINTDAGLARDRRQAETQDEDDDRQDDDQPVRVAPAQGRREEAGDDEGDSAGDRGDTGQHAQRRCLLPAVVVRGDQHHQRRNERGGGNSRDRLGNVHHARVGAGRHQTHRDAVRD